MWYGSVYRTSKNQAKLIYVVTSLISGSRGGLGDWQGFKRAGGLAMYADGGGGLVTQVCSICKNASSCTLRMCAIS